MTIAPTSDQAAPRPIQLWPGIAIVILQWLTWVVVPLVFPGVGPYSAVGALACGLAIVVWWLCFSRAPWAERVGAIVLMVAAVMAMNRVVHPSLANGMMGMLLPLYATPPLSLALVGWAVVSRGSSTWARRAALAAAIVVVCGAFMLLRTDGVTGGGASDFHWRWTPTAEERLLAQSPQAAAAAEPAPVAPPPVAAALSAETRPPAAARDQPAAPAPASAAAEATAPEPAMAWPGFRGPHRDSVVPGVRIATDWVASPPVQVWRRPIGPGWSSFAVRGDLLYTQEQRGGDEVVSCYRVSTGEPVWAHRDGARFWESNAGAGPRSTPALSDDRVYTLGATGILNALDTRTGAVQWTRSAASDTGIAVPDWGFAGSPLVVGDSVIVAAAGTLVAYDRVTGARQWSGPPRGGGYSSPQAFTIDGVPQVLLMSDAGVASVAPADGTLLWEHGWKGAAIVQPAQVADGGFVIGTADPTGGTGLKRLAVVRGSGGWKAEERWTSRGLKPYFNDFVVHKGHAFGLDGAILSCIDLADGRRTWKGGRYGNGQLVLLPDQDLLLVLSEDGELALVAARPDQFTEMARVPGIDGKTWNHPALAGDVLLVRNGQEMAAFRLVRERR
jgi:outer membrane protein assembly factor BamB